MDHINSAQVPCFCTNSASSIQEQYSQSVNIQAKPASRLKNRRIGGQDEVTYINITAL